MRPGAALLNCGKEAVAGDVVPLTLVFILCSKSLSSSVVLGLGLIREIKNPGARAHGAGRTQYEAFALHKEEADQTCHGAHATHWSN